MESQVLESRIKKTPNNTNCQHHENNEPQRQGFTKGPKGSGNPLSMKIAKVDYHLVCLKNSILENHKKVTY